MLVADHLDLHVTGLRQVFLQVHTSVPKGNLRLGARRRKDSPHLLGSAHDAHSAATSACYSLEHHGVANVSSRARRPVHVGERLLDAGYDRHSRVAHHLARGCLVAHRLDHAYGWAYERDAHALADLAEVSVLREEAISRM